MHGVWSKKGGGEGWKEKENTYLYYPSLKASY